MTINVITLQGCPKCAKIKNLLAQNNIEFTIKDCEDNPSICDTLEDATNTMSYPMIVITRNNEIEKVIYVGEDYEELNKTRELNGGILGIPVYSIDSMLSYVKNSLNLK